jgi:hypothetical protein
MTFEYKDLHLPSRACLRRGILELCGRACVMELFSKIKCAVTKYYNTSCIIVHLRIHVTRNHVEGIVIYSSHCLPALGTFARFSYQRHLS